MMGLLSSKVVGEAAGSSDQIHEFQEDDLTLFVAVSTANEGIATPVDLLLTIRSIAKSLWEDFLKRKTEEESLYQALRISVVDANKHFSSSQVALDIGATLITPTGIYYVMTEGLDAFLFRGNIIKLTGNSSTRGGSGSLKPGDIFAMVAKPLQRPLLGLSFESSFDDLTDNLRTKVLSLQSTGIALLLHIPKDEKEPEGIVEEPASGMIEREEEVSESRQKQPFQVAAKIPSFKLKRPNIFVPKSEYETNVRVRSRKTSIVGGILVVILLVSILLGVRQNNTKMKEKAFSEKVKNVELILDEAQKSGTLNKVRTRELLTEAEAQISDFSESEKQTAQYKDLSDKIKRDYSDLTGLYLVDAENFLDLTLQASDFKGTSLASAEGVVYILDSSKNRVVSIEVESKRTKSVGNTEGLSNIKKIAAYSDRLFAVTGDGLYELTSRNTKVLPSEWKEDNLFKLFASNLYVLSQGDNMIYRYSGQTVGFGEKNTWIAPNVEVHIDNAISWSIDGTIWVLSKGGRLTRFTQGLPQVVNVTGVSSNLSSATKLITNEELANIYILDSGNKRIVVLDKKGVFVAEYVAPEIEDTIDFSVFEDQGKIILLTETKLLSIPLTHKE